MFYSDERNMELAECLCKNTKQRMNWFSEVTSSDLKAFAKTSRAMNRFPRVYFMN